MEPARRDFWIALGVSLILVAVAGGLYFLREVERKQRIAAEEHVTTLTRVKEALEQDLEEVNRAKADLEVRLDELQQQAQVLSQQTEQERRQRQTAEEELKTRQQELRQARQELERYQSRATELDQQLGKIRRDFNWLNEQFARLQQEKTNLQSRIEELTAKKPIELEKIVVKVDEGRAGGPQQEFATTQPVSPWGPPTMQPPAIQSDPFASAKGKVLVVNREFDFVVLNLGEQDGLRSGQVLSVWRENRQIGKVQVEKVFETMSSAVVLPGTRASELKEGDSIRLL